MSLTCDIKRKQKYLINRNNILLNIVFKSHIYDFGYFGYQKMRSKLAENYRKISENIRRTL